MSASTRRLTSVHPMDVAVPQRMVFHGVSCSSALSAGTSDLRRVYLTRLCCAFRLSQPLDALFRFQPLRPCFMPVTPLSFYLQGFPPICNQLLLSKSPSPPALLDVHPETDTLDFRVLSCRWVRALRSGVTRGRRSFPSWPLCPPGVSPLRPRHRLCAVSSHGLQHSASRRTR